MPLTSMGMPEASAASSHPRWTNVPILSRCLPTSSARCFRQSCERGDRSDAFCPVRAADKGPLGCLHDRRDADYRCHRETVAERLGEDGVHPGLLRGTCTPPVFRRSPEVTSSKMSTAPDRSAALRTPARKPGAGS